MNMRWKKQPKLTGLAAVCADPQGSDLHDGENTFAWTSYRNGNFSNVTGWYWVSSADKDLNIGYMNTCQEPVATEKEAKTQAKAYINSCIK